MIPNRPATTTALLRLFVAGFVLPTAPLAGQSAGQAVPVDTSSLGTGPHAGMHMLLEKTILKVDVLSLDIRFGPEATARFASLLGDHDAPARAARDRDALADSVAAVALAARDVFARIEFHRAVGLGRFLDGIRDNLRRATKAGIVTVSEYRDIADGLPGWYAFLADRGIRSGDRMFYRIRGDSLRTVYVAEDGRTLLDQVDVGPHRRLSVLGGYFAPDSDFREGLFESALAARGDD